MILDSRICFFPSLALLFIPAAIFAAEPTGKVNFNRDVRPILSDNCFSCHGFDAKKRKGDLRLDVEEGAFKPNKDGVSALKPRDLAASEAWKRIVTMDEDDVMPPPDSHKKLTADQRD
ncbi:MAG: c-type cytochrome domain-containing protein, partial [Roseimicrobium sp.]